MTANEVPSPGDLMTRVVEAFDRMPVPPAPSVSETIGRLERMAAGQGGVPAMMANALPEQLVVPRLEDRPDIVTPPTANATFTDTRSAQIVRRSRWTARQRIAAGSIGLSAVVGLVLILSALSSPAQLSAMERIAKKLHEVKSYSYKLSTENTFVKEGSKQPTSVKRSGTAVWLAPGSLFAAEKIVHVDAPVRPGDDQGELIVDITEVFPANKPGVLINHKAKTFTRLPVLKPDDIPPFSPVNQLKMVREGRGKIVRDLGTKEINGKPVRGYVMALASAEPRSGRDALEVWVDPETDLPVEFGYTVMNDKGPEFFRVTDCRWNIDVDPEVFATAPLKGYADVTPAPAEETP